MGAKHVLLSYCHDNAKLVAQLREVGQLGEDQEIRSPTEAQWEWAARGPDRLKYPWGNDWQEDACNSKSAGVDHTTAVGLFPAVVRRR